VGPFAHGWRRAADAGARRRLGRAGNKRCSLSARQPVPRHELPLGEEFLVLDGHFADKRGEYPAGTYVRNPSGSGHAPWSEDGCVLFVKLRQFHSEDLERIVVDTRSAKWFPAITKGIAVLPLHGFGSERVSLVRWAPHTRFVPHVHPGGEEIFARRRAGGRGRPIRGRLLAAQSAGQPARAVQPGRLPAVRENRAPARRGDVTSARRATIAAPDGDGSLTTRS
jgi:ChrR Cupin-like domain